MKILLTLPFILIGLFSLQAQDEETQVDPIKWLTFEEAMTLNEKEPRQIFIDVYTDWCGWCKKMDASTFTEKKVIEFLNSSSYYCVKLNAEQKEDITYNDKVYRFIPQQKRGYHEVAAMLLDGNLSYPSFVLLAPNLKRLDVVKGYMDKNQLLSRLKSHK